MNADLVQMNADPPTPVRPESCGVGPRLDEPHANKKKGSGWAPCALWLKGEVVGDGHWGFQSWSPRER